MSVPNFQSLIKRDMKELTTVNNPLERECIEYIIQNYISTFTNLFRKPFQELKYYRKRWNDLVIVQPPYNNTNGNVRYNDWSIISKSNGIDIRYEISSLDVDTTLRAKALEHALQFKNIPEKNLVLILIGVGYDGVEKDLKSLINKYKYPIEVIRTVQEYKKHIDGLFKKVMVN